MLAPQFDKSLVELPFVDLVENRMPNVVDFDSVLLVPVPLEWQRAEDVVDKLLDSLNPPRSPRPQLWRQVIEDGDAGGFGFAGDPPVEAGEVDEDEEELVWGT